MATSTNNYTLGRGKLYLALFAAGTHTPLGERFLGNAPTFSFSSSVTTLDHYASTGGIKVKDDSITLQVDNTGSLSLDDIQLDNVAMQFLGESLTTSVSSHTVTGETISQATKGLFYQLGTSDAKPTGARNVSAVTVKTSAATPVTLVLGTDYELDAELGRIHILDTSTVVTAATDLKVDYTEGASTREQMLSKGVPVEGALRFIADNPAGDNIDYFMPWVKIQPDGDYALFGDDWQVMAFTIQMLKDGSKSAIYADGRPMVS